MIKLTENMYTLTLGNDQYLITPSGIYQIIKKNNEKYIIPMKPLLHKEQKIEKNINNTILNIERNKNIYD